MYPLPVVSNRRPFAPSELPGFIATIGVSDFRWPLPLFLRIRLGWRCASAPAIGSPRLLHKLNVRLYGLKSRDVCHSSPKRYDNCCLPVSPDYRPYPMRLFRDFILQGQHHLLPLRLASSRAYASSASLPIRLQGSIPGSWLAITWAGFPPASLCSIARPQRA